MKKLSEADRKFYEIYEKFKQRTKGRDLSKENELIKKHQQRKLEAFNEVFFAKHQRRFFTNIRLSV